MVSLSKMIDEQLLKISQQAVVTFFCKCHPSYFVWWRRNNSSKTLPQCIKHANPRAHHSFLVAAGVVSS